MKRNLLTQIFSLFLLFSIVSAGLVQTPAQGMAKTRIIDTVTDAGGNPRSGVVTFILTQKSVVGPAGLITAKATVSASLDVNGRFDISVYPSRSLSPASYYQVWLKDAATANQELLGIYDIPSSSTNISLSGYKVTDTNLAAQYTFASKTDVDRLTTATATAVLNPSTITNSLGYVPLKPSLNLSELTSQSAARANLGLGSMATQNSSSVTVTGGTMANITCTNCTNVGSTTNGAFAATNDEIINYDSDANHTGVGRIQSGGVDVAVFNNDGSINVPGLLTSKVIDAGGQVANVLAFGADNTGATSVTTAVTNAINALSASGGTVLFPSVPAGGCYLVSSAIPYNLKSNVTFKGEPGAKLCANSNMFIFGPSGSGYVENVTWDGLTFNYDHPSLLADGIYLSGSYLGSGRITHCRFIGKNLDGVTSTDAIRNLVIEDNLFDARGSGTAWGVNFQEVGQQNVVVHHNVFRYLYQSIKIGGAPADPNGYYQSAGVRIESNRVEGGWAYSVEDFSGTSATYTTTTLTASGFSGISGSGNGLVRLLSVRGTADRTGDYSSKPGEIHDSGATFVSSGVSRGQIVRTSGGKFAIVQNVIDETHARVEQWLSNTDRTPAAPPGVSETYTIYGLIFGLVQSSNSTQITVARWFGLTGATVAISSIDRYEVVRTMAAQQIIVSAQGAMVYDNLLIRPRDGITVTNRSRVRGNYILNAEDTGITVEGAKEADVEGNTIIGSGSNGILLHNADDSIVTGNRVVDSGLIVPSTTINANVYLLNSSRVKVSNNKLYQVASANTTTRSLIIDGADSSTNQASGNKIVDNEARGHSPSLPFYVTANGVTGAAVSNQFLNNGSAPDVQGSASGTIYDYVDASNVRHMSSLPVTP